MLNPVRSLFAILAVAGLSACASQPNSEVSKRHDIDSWPAMRSFAEAPVPQTKRYSNRDLFGEFLDLAFTLESGHRIERFTRFEGPISVSFKNTPRAQVSRELDALVGRLRAEANINISRSHDGSDADIMVETLTRDALHRAAPNAACIVVPRVSSWAEFRRNRFNNKTDWSSLDRRDRAMIFMPHDISVQEARDCLHEELAQALGPLNDLYRLPDSVFNDDNFHIVLTSYDMMILRIYYASELRNGMAKHQVADVLPRILARINPEGQIAPDQGLTMSDRNWINAIEASLAVRGNDDKRLRDADTALKLAQAAGYTDHRLGFSYFARARVGAATNRELAAADFARAYAIFRKQLGRYDIHTAQAALQMASLAMSSGRIDQAEAFINDSLIAANAAQNGRLMFSLLAMKAEIALIRGDAVTAQALQREAVSWGRYSIADTPEIQQRLDIISSLSAQKGGDNNES